VITSATINPAQFSRHFGGAPVIEVSGRTYPVTTLYRPLTTDERTDDDAAWAESDADLTEIEGVVAAVRALWSGRPEIVEPQPSADPVPPPPGEVRWGRGGRRVANNRR
jgi:hypothetical protein